MKKLILTLAGLVIASVAFASVDPTRPMVTGRGNVSGRPGKVIATNQTQAKADETVRLEKFQVTGSLLKHPAAKK
jgi:hypothetical protein